MRITPPALAVALAAALVATFASALPAAAGQAPSGQAPSAREQHYLVHVDPRLCPSPMCGGYWVQLANRSRTRCGDGTMQPRCYVWRAVDKGQSSGSAAAGLPEGGLALGRIQPSKVQGFGELAELVVTKVRAPAGRATKLLLYRVRDTGIRCVRAPCFFMRAWRLATSYTLTVSELDLGRAGLTPAEQTRAEAALETKSGLFLAGRVERASDGGRRLAALRVYLTVSPPRG